MHDITFYPDITGIEAIIAEIDKTVEHFQIISFEDHNKCAAGTTEEIVGSKNTKKALEGSQKATAPISSHL